VRSSPTALGRSKADRDELIEQYLPLVRYVVARLPVTMPATLDRDDFYSVGVMGLIHAANAYDPNRGASFKTFAFTAIRGAVLDEIRRHDPVPRSRRDRLRRMEKAKIALCADLQRSPTIEELAEFMEVSADDLDQDLLALHTCRMLSIDDSSGGSFETGFALGSRITNESATDPASGAERRETLDALTRAIAELPEADRNVVILYHYEDLYLKEIGEILGVSESRVSQVLTRATERLKLKMKPADEH
jgi:RNA polymerase sigma factor for flagellar operon FliA